MQDYVNFIKAKKINKIVIMGDLTRNYDKRTKTPADGAINDIYNFLSQQIKSVVDIEIVKETCCLPRLFDRDAFYSACGKKTCEAEWINLYSESPHEEGVIYFKQCFDNALIIFQEAGVLRKYAEAANIPYIDMFISSLRYTEDLNYAMRTNVGDTYEKLVRYAIPEMSFYAQANLIKVFYNHHGKVNIEDNSCILFGQTEIDLSLIKDGKLHALTEYISKIEELSQTYTIYYKPHPLAKQDSELEKTIRSLPYIKIAKGNTYQLLSSDKVKAVCALSSSILKEAKYFDKKVYTLLQSYVDYYNENLIFSKDNFIIVSHECFSTSFWHDVLEDFTFVKTCQYFNFNNNNNFLRNLLNAYYGYEADDFVRLINETNAANKRKKKLDNEIIKIQNRLYILQNNRIAKLFLIKSSLYFNNFLYKISGKKQYEVSVMKSQNKLSMINMKKGDNRYSNITVVLQGSTIQKFNGIRCVELSVASIRKLMPSCKIILSTWEGESIPKGLMVDRVIFNKDPGFYTRDCTEKGKKNNVNRQIVSTLAGLKEVNTDYSLKLRTDFILTNLNFLKYHNNYRKFNDEYRIFERRLLCSIFDTRKPYGEYYNLPYHVGDLFFYGQTKDLLKLFDIPLVTKEEFTYFIDHSDIKPNTFARNRYNAEQSIWMGCLRKNGMRVLCEYSTHINDEIAAESDLFLVNNFVPYSFKEFGALPLKVGLRAENRYLTYCDNYMTNEWHKLYQKIVLGKASDTWYSNEEKIIKCATRIRKSNAPNYVKEIIYSFLRYRVRKIFDE